MGVHSLAGLRYTQVSAGYGHTVLLRSDGEAVACGRNGDGQRDIPALPSELARLRAVTSPCSFPPFLRAYTQTVIPVCYVVAN